jgi:hypothetical protein
VEDHKKRAADDKESRRWLDGVETVGHVLAEAASRTARATSMTRSPAARPTWICGCGPRRTGRAGEQLGLFEACQQWTEVDRSLIKVPAKRGRDGKPQRAERTALVAVRFGAVTIRRPATADKALPETLTLRVVDVREVDPPDPEQRVRWCLLTTHAVDTPDDARRMVRWYQLRWTIEPVFRTMKTGGVDVETSQITTPNSLLKLVVVALIAAIRIMQMVIGRDGSTGQPLTDVIAEPAEVPALQAINATLQGRTEKLQNPYDPASLPWYAWIAARLGGWSGYTSKGYKPAGPKIIARGLKKLDAMVRGFLLANHSAVI